MFRSAFADERNDMKGLSMSQAHGCRMEIAFNFLSPGIQRTARFLDLRFMQGGA
jgi:hypothetical protein